MNRSLGGAIPDRAGGRKNSGEPSIIEVILFVGLIRGGVFVERINYDLLGTRVRDVFRGTSGMRLEPR